jgi:DNA mismatch repair protein MutS2
MVFAHPTKGRSNLKRHPQVECFETAPQNEGGAGVTIVYLK